MTSRNGSNEIVNARALIVSLSLAAIGLSLILIAATFDCEILKINADGLMADTGALLLIIGVLQWAFDNGVRKSFFREIRSEIVGSTHISESGICDYFEDSKSVNFDDHFLTSSKLTIGVNYSAKLIDNSIELLARRTSEKKKTKILFVNESSEAAKFLNIDYKKSDIQSSIDKIKEIAKQHDSTGKYITLLPVDTILRYSFVQFDSRIWVVIGTNGLGRRAVPGFFVRAGTSWYDHFSRDIELLCERT